jgi:aminoglycoside phosphotransferase (APT) family kinase protein
MSKRTATQIKTKAEMVKKIIKHHFGRMPRSIQFQPAGKTNFVFEVNCYEGVFIVRIANNAQKLHDFIKEQWAVDRVLQQGVPVAEIVEVGNEVVKLPYMIQKKLGGCEASNHPDRLQILEQLGGYARLIHSIATSDYGKVFDWSKNRLSKNDTWINYLNNEWDVKERLKIIRSFGLLSLKKMNKLERAIQKMEKWTFPPALNHGDLRLKNVIVSDKGKIEAIIDWENCLSNIAPYWDLSIALHDLSIDGKHHFLSGYGMDLKEYEQYAYGIKVFNVLNYAPTLEQIAHSGDQNELQLYQLRLNGMFDLFTL